MKVIVIKFIWIYCMMVEFSPPPPQISDVLWNCLQFYKRVSRIINVSALAYVISIFFFPPHFPPSFLLYLPSLSLSPLHSPSLYPEEDVSLPKDQMEQLKNILTSSFFNSVKEVRKWIQYSGNFQGRKLSRIGKNTIFADCSLLQRQWTPPPKFCGENFHV